MTDKWLSILNDGSDRLICQSPERCLSMQQMRWWIHQLRSAVAKYKNSHWVLYDSDGFHFLCALFALLSLGKNVAIPSGPGRAEIIAISESNPGVIGAHSDFSQINTSDLWEEKFSDAYLESDLITCEKWGEVNFYTSGSSGKPKIITKTVDQLYLEAAALQQKWQPKENALLIPLVPHAHIYGLVFAFLFPLVTRASFYLPKNSGLLGVLSKIAASAHYPLSELLVVTSPTIGRQIEKIQLLAEAGSAGKPDRPAAVSRVFCAGDKLTDDNAKNIIKLFNCPVTEIFGSTETGSVAWREHSKQSKAGIGNLWKLLPGLHLAATQEAEDDKNQPSMDRRLAVWGGHVGGARKDAVATGDQVKLHSRNEFQLIGRNPQVHKIEGKRVSLVQIVETLNGCDLISYAVVLAHEKAGKETLYSGVVLSDSGVSEYQQQGKFFVDQSIKKYLIQFFDPVLVPRIIRYLDQEPHDDMGKLPQAKLIDLLVNPTPPKLPLVEDIELSQTSLRFSLRIPMELIYLQGHFEHRPIVPAIALVHWVCCLVEGQWPLAIAPGSMKNLKFHSLVTPGLELDLIIKRVEGGIEFLYTTETLKFSSGYIAIQ